jgi:hypothetical protein
VLAATGVTLVALTAGLVFSRPTLDSYDAQIMFTVAGSIVTTHTAVVPRAADGFRLNSPHASYGLGMSLLEVPAIVLADQTGRSSQRLAMLVNPVLFALIALALFAWARMAGAGVVRAAVLAMVCGFGTLLLPYTQTGGSDLGTALGVAVALVGVELARSRTRAGGLVAGIGVAIAVLMRPDSGILIAPAVVVAVLLTARRALPFCLLSAAPGAVVTGLYNYTGGAAYAGIPLRLGWSHSFLAGVEGLLVSPGRGLLLFVPLTLLAVIALPWAWRRSPVVTGLCVALLAGRVAFYAGWFAWAGGWTWGPRFLVPAMPALAPLLLPILQVQPRRRWQLAAAVAAVPLVALSVAVQVLGAAVRYDTDADNHAMVANVHIPPNSDPRTAGTAPAVVAAQDAAMFDWRYFPILEHARKLHHGRDLTTQLLALTLAGPRTRPG